MDTRSHPSRFGYSRKSRIIPEDVGCKENKLPLVHCMHNAYDTYVCEESDPIHFDKWYTE